MQSLWTLMISKYLRTVSRLRFKLQPLLLFLYMCETQKMEHVALKLFKGENFLPRKPTVVSASASQSQSSISCGNYDGSKGGYQVMLE